MEIILEAKDAGDWSYRGEGAANLVLAYTGSSPRFVGKVVRVHKVSRKGSDKKNDLSPFTNHERLVWKDVKELLSAPTREVAQQLYVQHVMTPLLGPEHVDVGIRVRVSKEFLESIEESVRSQRPTWRVSDAKVDTESDSVLLLFDLSIFPRRVLKDEFFISVELKPKCGFVPISKFIAEENTVKRSVTRFKMHQALKFHLGEISEVSKYDPLDLFSGSIDRVIKAMTDLFLTPQNNFRVFLNGSLIFGGLGGGTNSTSCLTGETFEDVLKCVIPADNGLRTTSLLKLVAEVVTSSSLIKRMLEVQKLDKLDIEGVIHAYYNVVSQPCMVCKELGGKLSEKYASLHSDSLGRSLKIVKDYLVAATAKDLSMMISFRPTGDRDMGSSRNVVLLKSGNQSFEYKVSFIDLDMKPLKKIEYYYELDEKIVRCYSQMGKTQHHSAAGAANIEQAIRREHSGDMEDAYHVRDSAGK